MMKASGEEGRWGRWEVVRKGSGEEVRDSVLELQFPTPLRVDLLCFATQSLQIAL